VTGDGHRAISHPGVGGSGIGYRKWGASSQDPVNRTIGIERMRCHRIPTERQNSKGDRKPDDWLGNYFQVTGDGHQGIGGSGDGGSGIGYRESGASSQDPINRTIGIERMRCHRIPTSRQRQYSQRETG
jgi:hypothetical protein